MREAAGVPGELAVAHPLVDEARDRAARGDGEPVELVLDDAGARRSPSGCWRTSGPPRAGSRTPCSPTEGTPGAEHGGTGCCRSSTTCEGTSGAGRQVDDVDGQRARVRMSATSRPRPAQRVEDEEPRIGAGLLDQRARAQSTRRRVSAFDVRLDLGRDLSLPGDAGRGRRRWARRSRSRARSRGPGPGRPGRARPRGPRETTGCARADQRRERLGGAERSSERLTRAETSAIEAGRQVPLVAEARRRPWAAWPRRARRTPRRSRSSWRRCRSGSGPCRSCSVCWIVQVRRRADRPSPVRRRRSCRRDSGPRTRWSRRRS